MGSSRISWAAHVGQSNRFTADLCPLIDGGTKTKDNAQWFSRVAVGKFRNHPQDMNFDVWV
jgi:hypothetical protein